MDRFIVGDYKATYRVRKHLKSNMDRFIDRQAKIAIVSIFDLKSNMDRFIDCTDRQHSEE